jgi:phospholipase C
MSMNNIRHLVVLMLENRSFDNMVGWLYVNEGNRPPVNIPMPASGQPTYDGLTAPSPTSDFWNPTNEDFFTGAAPVKENVTTQVRDFRMPKPDPEEHFNHITFQLFGPQLALPGAPNQMKGFYLDYTHASKNPADIMQCYSSGQVPVISRLARNYAICDRWHASCPTQTWPNRAFVHLGTSLGKVNNWPYDPLHYNIDTIFNILEGCEAPWGGPVTWGVYNDSILPSLTRLQLPKLWDPSLDGNFHSFETFKQHAQEGELPTYSFVEPSFIFDPNDEHPPHDVRLGEQFIEDVYNAVRSGKKWAETLLVVTYDEHGGCYDHVPPPFGATPPDTASKFGDLGFGFDRFGVRVPAILVSPYITLGTVFRSPTAMPYDHTSILATLRDWLEIPSSRMLPSARIKAAPTFGDVLTAVTPRLEQPETALTARSEVAAFRVESELPPDEIQKSIIVAMETKRVGRTLAVPEVHETLAKIPTRGHLVNFLKLNV